MRRVLALVIVAAACLLTVAAATVAASAVGAKPDAVAARKIVVHARFKSLSKSKMTITYTAKNGHYSATWIGVRHYRLHGTINGRRLTGTIRTHQARNHDRYVARGSGKLGSRSVRITGGGPNSLKTATLVLS
jgi:hypothetical protein